MAQKGEPGIGVIRAGFFGLGVGLLLWCWHAPSINILWAGPLGLLMVVMSVGKMFAR